MDCSPPGFSALGISCPGKNTGVDYHQHTKTLIGTFIMGPITGKEIRKFSSVQSCPTLCNPMNCSMPGLQDVMGTAGIQLTQAASFPSYNCLPTDSRQAMLGAPRSPFLLICILSASPITFSVSPFSSRKTRLLANHFSDHRTLSPGNFGLLSITKVFKEL